jgi:Xaa-Pro aminopeptidase
MGAGATAVPFVGHGVGLEVDELPVLGKRQKTVLETNMILAVEPKATFADKGTVGIENMFRVTADGLERLTMADDAVGRIT